MKSATYADRIYTTGSAGLPGAKHIPNRQKGGKKDFSALIAHAKQCQPPVEIEHGEIIGGFAHHQVLALADKISGIDVNDFVLMLFIGYLLILESIRYTIP